MVRSIFLIRDPIRVFDSWKDFGWTDAQSLIDCYTNMFRMLHRAPSHAISCLINERLIQDPQTEVKRICARWGVPFSETMLDFKQCFGSGFLYSTDCEKIIYCKGKPLGLFTTVETNFSVEPDVPYHGLLSNTEKNTIEEHVGALYLSCWHDDVLRLRSALAEKTWIGFDLDDTLHEFRRSSGTATGKILEEISKRYGTPCIERRILQNSHHDDGKCFLRWKAVIWVSERKIRVTSGLFLPPRGRGIYVWTSDGLWRHSDDVSRAEMWSIGIVIHPQGYGQENHRHNGRPPGLTGESGAGPWYWGVHRLPRHLLTTSRPPRPKVCSLESSNTWAFLGPDMAYIGDNEQRGHAVCHGGGAYSQSILLRISMFAFWTTTPPQINTLRANCATSFRPTPPALSSRNILVATCTSTYCHPYCLLRCDIHPSVLRRRLDFFHRRKIFFLFDRKHFFWLPFLSPSPAP